MNAFLAHLQRQAARVPPPKEFVIRKDQVEMLAAHLRQNMSGDVDMDAGEPLRDLIMTGRVKMRGIPVRVESVEVVRKVGET
jgi:hypothetical protein